MVGMVRLRVSWSFQVVGLCLSHFTPFQPCSLAHDNNHAADLLIACTEYIMWRRHSSLKLHVDPIMYDNSI